MVALSNLRAWLCLVLAAAPVDGYIVSGFSSGANVAINTLFAFGCPADAEVPRPGLNRTCAEGMMALGGSPYGCNILPDSGATGKGNVCGTPPKNENWTAHNIRFLKYIEGREKAGLIAPLSSLRGKPVFLYSGLHDSIVNQPVMRALNAQLLQLGLNVTSIFDVPSEHAWIVDDVTCPNPHTPQLSSCCGDKGIVGQCESEPIPPLNASAVHAPTCCGSCADGSVGGWWRPPINNCGLDLSGAVLKKLLGASSLEGGRGRRLPARLLSFNQTVYTEVSANVSFMDEAAFLYVPSGCSVSDDCVIHVHYHCCDCNWRSAGEQYMLDNALLDWAETNRIITLFPQALNSDVTGHCWDWYGQTGENFDTKRGLQLNAVGRMIANVSRITAVPWPQ